MNELSAVECLHLLDAHGMGKNGKPNCLVTMVQEALEEMTTARYRASNAIALLIRCYQAGHREGWQNGETNTKVFDDVNNFLSDIHGPNWRVPYLTWRDARGCAPPLEPFDDERPTPEDLVLNSWGNQ